MFAWLVSNTCYVMIDVSDVTMNFALFSYYGFLDFEQREWINKRAQL